MNVFLLGYRGSGKSTLGRALAERLGRTFVDTDEEVCRRFHGASIREIWRLHGEPAFRTVEQRVVEEMLLEDGRVIALGGGTVMVDGARRALEQAPAALRIYLRCDPRVLWMRIRDDEQSRGARPSLTALGGGLDEVRSVLRMREPVYEALADRTLDVSRLNPEDALAHLLEACGPASGVAQKKPPAKPPGA